MQKKAKPRLSDRRKKEKNEAKELKLMLSQEEINSLEQLIKEDSGKLDFSDIKDFLRENNFNTKPSPSLQKINAPQKNPVILERDIITGNMSITNLEDTKNENNGDFKYLPNGIEREDKKYSPAYGERIANLVQRKEIEKIPSRDVFSKKEIKFNPSMEVKSPSQESFEKYSPSSFNVERLERDKKEKRDIFEKKEIKYTPSRY